MRKFPRQEQVEGIDYCQSTETMILRVSANSGVSLSVVVLRTLRLNRVHLSYNISFLNQALMIEDSTRQFGSKFHTIYILRAIAGMPIPTSGCHIPLSDNPTPNSLVAMEYFKIRR